MENSTITYGKLPKVILFLTILLIPFTSFAQNQSLDKLIQNAHHSNNINQVQLQELQSRAQTEGISNKELVQIIQPAVTLSEQNLPSQVIIQKALEGLSKSVSPKRIVPVLQHIQMATQKAAPVVELWLKNQPTQAMIFSKGRGTSKKQFRRQLIETVSEGVMEGTTPKSYSNLFRGIGKKKIVSKTDPPTIVAAVGVFSSLNATVQNAKTARIFLIRSLKAGFKTSEFLKLPSAMKVAQQRSQLPAKKVMKGASKQLHNGVSTSQVLDNLLEGNPQNGPPAGISPPGLKNKSSKNNGNNGRSNNSHRNNNPGNNGRGH